MKRHFWLILPWALFLVIAAGWIAYWNIVAGASEQRIRAWISEQETQGASASVSRIVRHGFPVLMRLELRNPSYAPARGGWRIDTAAADASQAPSSVAPPKYAAARAGVMGVTRSWYHNRARHVAAAW